MVVEAVDAGCDWWVSVTPSAASVVGVGAAAVLVMACRGPTLLAADEGDGAEGTMIGCGACAERACTSSAAG